MIRAHEPQADGYRMYRKSVDTGFPSVITIFSAPNYVDVYGNKAAVLKYDGQVLNVRQFSASPHPYWLPNFMNVFDWSLPFIGEKITSMLLAILNICTQEELESAGAALGEEGQEEEDVEQQEKMRRRHIIRNKIRAVGKLSRTFTILRENAELVNELKCVSDQTKLPVGTLGLGAEGMRKGKKSEGKEQCADGSSYFLLLCKAITTFEEARQSDLQNERLPPPAGKNRSAGKEEEQRLKEEDLDRLAHVIVHSPKTDTISPKSNGLSM